MRFTFDTDAHGNRRISLSHGERATGAVASARALANDRLSAPLTALFDAAARAAASIEGQQADLNDAGLVRLAARELGRLRTNVRAVIDSARLERDANAGELAALRTPTFDRADVAAATVRMQMRERLSRMKPAEAYAAALADRATLAAVLECPSVVGLSADLIASLNDEFAIGVVAAQFATDPRFKAIQSYSDPLATGADLTGARKFAEATYRAIEAKREAVDDAISAVRQMVDIFAVAADLGQGAAFDALTENGGAA